MIPDPLAYSVIIATYLRHSALCETLRRLSPFIDPKVGEIIVVEQCSTDTLPPDVLTIPGLRYLALGCQGMVNARNVGLGMARGRIVLYLDDDVIPLPGLITGHMAAYAEPSVGGVAGRILDPGQTSAPPPHPKVFDQTEGWRHAHFDHDVPGNVMTARGCNMSFRRDILISLGGFDPHIAIFRDDTDMCLRVISAGYKVRFVPAAGVVHLNAISGGTRGSQAGVTGYWGREIRMYRQHYRYYRDSLYFAIKHFGGRERLRLVADVYRTCVGLSRWPWRLAAKNLAFLLALWTATRCVRDNAHHPIALTDQ